MFIKHENVDNNYDYRTITKQLQNTVKNMQFAFKVDFAIAISVKYVNNTLYKRVLM